MSSKVDQIFDEFAIPPVVASLMAGDLFQLFDETLNIEQVANNCSTIGGTVGFNTLTNLYIYIKEHIHRPLKGSTTWENWQRTLARR